MLLKSVIAARPFTGMAGIVPAREAPDYDVVAATAVEGHSVIGGYDRTSTGNEVTDVAIVDGVTIRVRAIERAHLASSHHQRKASRILPRRHWGHVAGIKLQVLQQQLIYLFTCPSSSGSAY